MKQPVLVILAAGMGSRYGGLKQMDPVDQEGHKIIDFSAYDAMRAGFKKVLFIIKKENEQDFRQCVGDAMSQYIEVEYVYQELSCIPKGFDVPEGREKPFGTAHAVYCCRGRIDAPFAVINADDFYGQDGFRALYEYLTTNEDDQLHRYAMVSFRLGNTLTEHGTVSRGCCTQDEDGYLDTIIERTKVKKTLEGASYTLDGIHDIPISEDTRVSMNMWGFTKSFLEELEESMELFFQVDVATNPLGAESFLPFEVDRMLKAGKATVKMLESKDKWFGITYKEDKEMVVKAIQQLKNEGVYPEHLWK